VNTVPVRGEHRSRAYHLQCLVEGEALTDQVGDALQAEEPCVALVGVEHLGGRSSGQVVPRLDGAHAADAEQQLLQQAVLSSSAVQAVGHRAQPLLVVRDVRVEQQQRHAADGDLPDAGVQHAVREGERDLHRGAVRVAQDGQRKAVGVEHRVALQLPAVRRDRLGEVSGAVEEADADERHAEVARGLEVVAGEDAEAARVLRQGGGDPELRGEVCDGVGR